MTQSLLLLLKQECSVCKQYLGSEEQGDTVSKVLFGYRDFGVCPCCKQVYIEENKRRKAAYIKRAIKWIEDMNKRNIKAGAVFDSGTCRIYLIKAQLDEKVEPLFMMMGYQDNPYNAWHPIVNGVKKRLLTAQEVKQYFVNGLGVEWKYIGQMDEVLTEEKE